MLYLKRRDYEKILAYCQQELPEEACGLLGGRKLGKDCQVEGLYFLTNSDHSRVHFSMEPGEQFTAVKRMRARNLELVGNFHSHPDALAIPSVEDKRLACDTKFRYLILSLSEEEPVLKVFLLEEKELREEALVII